MIVFHVASHFYRYCIILIIVLEKNVFCCIIGVLITKNGFQ